MSYTLPGVLLTEERGAPSAFISPIHRNTVIVGKIAEYIQIKNEVVIRSSTGYADDFAFGDDGILSVLTVESKLGFGDYVEDRDWVKTGTGILWTSTGSIPIDGASYYVTYRKNRVASEYGLITCFNVEEMYAQAGYPTGDILEATLYGQLAFNVYGISVIYIQPVQPPYTSIKFTEAIQKLSNRNFQTVICPNSNATVGAALAIHAQERSLPGSKRERICWLGGPVSSTRNDIVTLGSTYKREEVIIVSIPRGQITYFNFDTNEEADVEIDGAGVGAVLGLYRDSFDDPSFSLLRAKIPGLTIFEADYDEFYTEEALQAFGAVGVLQIAPFKDSFTTPMVIDELTSDTTNFKTSSIAVTTAKHYNTMTVRDAIDETFTGLKIKDPVQYAGNVKNFLVELFGKLRRAGSLADFNAADILVQVGKSFDGTEVNASKVFISYQYLSIFIHKQTEGYYYLLP